MIAIGQPADCKEVLLEGRALCRRVAVVSKQATESDAAPREEGSFHELQIFDFFFRIEVNGCSLRQLLGDESPRHRSRLIRVENLRQSAILCLRDKKADYGRYSAKSQIFIE